MPIAAQGQTGASAEEQLAQALYAGQAPTIAGGQLSTAQALNQAGQAPSALAAGAANLESQYGYSLANAGLSEQSIGLQQQLTGQQIGTAQQQQAAEQGVYGLQQSQLALDPQSIALQQALLGTQEQVAGGQEALTQGLGGIGGGGYAAQLANLQQQLPLAQQQQAGQAAASGASSSVGNREAAGQITEQNQFNVGNVQSQAAQAALGYQGQQAQFAEQRGQLGLQNTSDYLQSQINKLQQSSEVAGYQGQQEQYQNTLAQLGNASAQAGIPAQQAYEQLSYGLSQLGVSSDMTPQIIQAMQGESTSAQGLAQVGQTAAASVGLGAGFGNY
jgi:hypothetical protein